MSAESKATGNTSSKRELMPMIVPMRYRCSLERRPWTKRLLKMLLVPRMTRRPSDGSWQIEIKEAPPVVRDEPRSYDPEEIIGAS
ncbi:unnamed protein product [Nezara viridula]|uniref:Uncharacterized protein n=1 Tax=Nezara viridula TaxID=85310 RepID=A0A9P0H3Y2_NEZVI|nr:unnamed protein product [Nezara viridula]